jgi:hypothetical protein
MEDYHKYYYKSEREAAFYALKQLRTMLPLVATSARQFPEWGTTIFRWKDRDGGGYKYGFQEPYEAITKDGFWQPLGKLPTGTEEWAHAHTHPNNRFFSTIDTATAKREKTVMYMVNQTGAFWFDGRTEGLEHKDRFGVITLW